MLGVAPGLASCRASWTQRLALLSRGVRTAEQAIGRFPPGCRADERRRECDQGTFETTALLHDVTPARSYKAHGLKADTDRMSVWEESWIKLEIHPQLP